MGCDPRSHSAVNRILSIKQRPWQKGLILLAGDIEQLEPYVDVDTIDMDPVVNSWPGPTTWILPAASSTAHWLKGDHDGIAVRVTDHPVAKLVCRRFHGAIVSTSANRKGRPPALSAKQVQREFAEGEIDFLLEGKLGGLDKPTRIVDAITGKRLR